MIKEYELPGGWSKTKLCDLLTKKQVKQVTKIIDNNLGDMIKLARALQEFLIPLRDQLEAKGVMPEFLAYSIAHAVQSNANKNC